MLDITIGGPDAAAKVLALPVDTVTEPMGAGSLLADTESALGAEIAAFLAEADAASAAGTLNALPRPGRDPGHVLLVGAGSGTAADWRAVGAAVVRAAASRHPAVTLRLPAEALVASVAEGAWLAAYRYRLAADPPDRAPVLRRLVLAIAAASAADEVARARAVVDAVVLARDLTNTPSLQKSPKWLADRVANAASRRKGLTVTVHDEHDLVAGGFGGILAVGAGSARPPRLVEISWRPGPARGRSAGSHRKPVHVVLVGKGITFDSGGISIKPLDGMKLMRKDMAGAAAVCATVLGAADLALPVRVTVLAPLAENMVSGAAARPGDVVRHYGGLTTEVQNTDAEGRVVLGDALAYAARRLKPDYLIDLATLTGASHVALGKRTAALFTHNDDLAAGLTAAGEEVGEAMWRLPLAEEYLSGVTASIADLNNSPPGPGALTAALYLREFTGDLRSNWAHIDMSAPSWSDNPQLKGATGWGVQMLLRWLATL